ncbi:hypothetical protein DYBT9623_05420 [Dyadobacter sp. CECT 9623]|uniref:Glycosyl-4,4'-diaponeurosporenoate acyltransferase n=2 Tax=Dyadobacter linearis TaxID=2823330 RepID=A0ABM8UYR0_9BACT|nr:hypothetical protein DYBT9623_05420 [Dyadobacter sp. CECT 9623]
MIESLICLKSLLSQIRQVYLEKLGIPTELRSSMKKAFTSILIIIVTIALVWALIHFIGMKGFLFAWTLNFLLMACTFTFTETLKSPLASPYFTDRTWERKGKIYESVGVNLYRKLLVWTGWEKLNKKANPIEKNNAALTHLHYQTKKSELGHLIILIIVLGLNIFVAFKYGVRESLSLLVLNILLNLYPILLQRYNRPRIERAMGLSRRKSGF